MSDPNNDPFYNVFTPESKLAALNALASTFAPPGTPGTRRRADWATNANDMYMCPLGHLQYNLLPEEKEELIAKGEKVPPICQDGGVCRHCTETVEKLPTDAKSLQYKLSTATITVTQLCKALEGFKETSDDYVKITMFVRENYGWEIEQGQGWHDEMLSKAVMHYLRIERSRVSVTAGRIWRALLRLIGAR